MGAVAFLVLWSGYTCFTYGWATVRGCNVKFGDLAIPGRWAKGSGCNPDKAQGTSAPTSTGVNILHDLVPISNF